MKASEVATFLGEALAGTDFEISGLASLDQLRPGSLSFSKSGEVPDDVESVLPVLILVPETDAFPKDGCTRIRVKDPRTAFATVAASFFSDDTPAGIHRSAVIAADARVDASATIGPNCVVSAGCVLGARTVLTSGVYLGPKSVIGADCSIGPNTTIGHPGFGFAIDSDSRPFRLPHIGHVLIGDHVDLGALNTVCSGTLHPTILESYVKTDDHVHIAHNVQIKENTMIASHASIAGSVVIESGCWIAPNSTVLNGLHVGERSTIGMGATVMRNVAAGETVMGAPAKRIVSPPSPGSK